MFASSHKHTHIHTYTYIDFLEIYYNLNHIYYFLKQVINMEHLP